jgi:hypothetical protein
MMQKNLKNFVMTNKKNENVLAVSLAKEVVQILDEKCKQGCAPENRSWIGFENGDGIECGNDIERLIKQAKNILKK